MSPEMSQGGNGARGGIRTHTGFNSHKALNLACLPISPPELRGKEDWENTDHTPHLQAVNKKNPTEQGFNPNDSQSKSDIKETLTGYRSGFCH